MNVSQAIDQIKIFEHSAAASRKKLECYAMLKRYKKGSHVFFDQDQVNYIYGVISGMVALYKISVTGEKKVIFVYREGYLLNEVMVQDLPASVNCEVLEDAWIVAVPRDLLLELMEEDPELMRAVMDSMALKIRRLYRQLKNTPNSIHGDKKIAAKLWKLQKDYGKPVADGVEIQMDLNITYLADMVGSKRETVSRQVKQLTELGLIKVNRNRMTVKDPERLSAYFKEKIQE